MGLFSAYHRRVAVEVETSIDIYCARTVVAAYVSNPDNAPEWYVNDPANLGRSDKPFMLGTATNAPPSGQIQPKATALVAALCGRLLRLMSIGCS
jgi:hypothetical protein